MRLAAKAISLMRSGTELPERVRNKLDGWFDRSSPPSALSPIALEDELFRVFSQLGIAVGYLAEERLLQLERRIEERRRELVGVGPFENFHDGTTTLGRICYATCRALQPATVVETGVAYGVTSAYVLQALAENGKGELHSIDLPPLGRNARSYVGHMVPDELRWRWNLRIGPARKLLPTVFRNTGGADVFIHDSLHTYAHMRWEISAALEALHPGGVLIADDINGNRAFDEALWNSRVAAWFAIREQEKDAACGVMRLKYQ